MSKRYYVKHDDLYAADTGNTLEWRTSRDGAIYFLSREMAFAHARMIRRGPRQFGGLGSRARVVSVPRPQPLLDIAFGPRGTGT